MKKAAIRILILALFLMIETLQVSAASEIVVKSDAELYDILQKKPFLTDPKKDEVTVELVQKGVKIPPTSSNPVIRLNYPSKLDDIESHTWEKVRAVPNVTFEILQNENYFKTKKLTLRIKRIYTWSRNPAELVEAHKKMDPFILKYAGENVSDVDKIYAWVEYCSQHFAYDYDELAAVEGKPSNFDPKKDKTIVLDGRGVCGEFADKTAAALNYMNFKGKYAVVTNGIDHAWAEFYLNGRQFAFEGTESASALSKGAPALMIYPLDPGVSYYEDVFTAGLKAKSNPFVSKEAFAEYVRTGKPSVAKGEDGNTIRIFSIETVGPFLQKHAGNYGVTRKSIQNGAPSESGSVNSQGVTMPRIEYAVSDETLRKIKADLSGLVDSVVYATAIAGESDVNFDGVNEKVIYVHVTFSKWGLLGPANFWVPDNG